MAKINMIQKHRRTQKAILNRTLHGDPHTGKLKSKPLPIEISGKRKRKLFKKARREQNEAMRNGLMAIDDMQMPLIEAGGSGQAGKSPSKFQMKKKLKQMKHKGKKKSKSSKPSEVASVDAMAE